MSDPDWISAKEVIERLTGGSDHPETAVLRCVRDHDCKSRAKALLLNGQAVASRALLYDSDDNDRDLQYLRPRFWEKIAKDGIQDWKLGCFNYTEEAPPEHFGYGVWLNWQAVGVEFYWPHLQTLLKLNKDQSVRQASRIGVLPPGASSNNRKYAALAHKAAEIIQLEGLKRSTAIKRLAEEAFNEMANPPIQASIERAIRAAYDLMYDDRGDPRRIDPK